MKLKYVFTAALLIVITAFAYAGASHGPIRNVGAFTLKKSVVIYKKDGAQEVRRVIYRRSSDGSFRIIETDGNVIFHDRGFTQGKGFFTVDYGSKSLWRHPDQKPQRGPVPADPAIFTRDSFYAGTDTLLGRAAYHLRAPNERGGVDTDDWFFPETGHVPVKSIMYLPDGRIEKTSEVYSLDFDEPDPTLVRLPDLPVLDVARGK